MPVCSQHAAPVLKDCERVSWYWDSNGEWRKRHCESPRCCLAGRARWARRKAAVLKKSFRDRSPTHELRLTIFRRGVGPLLRALARFLKRLKRELQVRQRAEFEYCRVIEWSSDGQVHAHLPVRTTGDLTEKLVRDLWIKSCPGGGASSHCEPVRCPEALAKYVVKDVLGDEDKVLVPAGFQGRIFSCSRNFLAAPEPVLWRACQAEWHGNGQDHHTIP